MLKAFMKRLEEKEGILYLQESQKKEIQTYDSHSMGADSTCNEYADAKCLSLQRRSV